jgi:hypothetical protein
LSKMSSFSISFNWLSFDFCGQALRNIALSIFIALFDLFWAKRLKASLSPWPSYKMENCNVICWVYKKLNKFEIALKNAVARGRTFLDYIHCLRLKCRNPKISKFKIFKILAGVFFITEEKWIAHEGNQPCNQVKMTMRYN